MDESPIVGPIKSTALLLLLAPVVGLFVEMMMMVVNRSPRDYALLFLFITNYW